MVADSKIIETNGCAMSMRSAFDKRETFVAVNLYNPSMGCCYLYLLYYLTPDKVHVAGLIKQGGFYNWTYHTYEERE